MFANMLKVWSQLIYQQYFTLSLRIESKRLLLPFLLYLYVCTNAFTLHCKSMFAIGWMELGEADKAQSLLQKCFSNIQGPFQVSFWVTHALHAKTFLLTGDSVNGWLPLLTGMEWIIRRLWCSQLPHGYGRIPASCTVWLHRLQVRITPQYTVSHKRENTADISANILLYLFMGQHWRNDTLLQCKVVRTACITV